MQCLTAMFLLELNCLFNVNLLCEVGFEARDGKIMSILDDKV